MRSKCLEYEGMKFSPDHPYHNMPALEGHVTVQFHKWLRRVLMSNHMDDYWYQRKQEVRPFFQGGSVYEHDGWILVEFWTKDVEAARIFCEDMCMAFIKNDPISRKLYGGNND
jgi:hypothetical protein